MEQTLFFIEMIFLTLVLFKTIFNKKYYLKTGGFWFYIFFVAFYGTYRYLYCYAPIDKFFDMIKGLVCIGAFTYLEKYYFKETFNTKSRSLYKNLQRRGRITAAFSISSTAVLIIIALMVGLYSIIDTFHYFAVAALTFICADMIVFSLNSTKDRKPLYILFILLELIQQLILSFNFTMCWNYVIVGPILATIKILQCAILFYNVLFVKEAIYEWID